MSTGQAGGEGASTRTGEGRGEGEGLTKPLYNNVGGVSDQDAPSADQLLEGRPGAAWGDQAIVRGDRGDRGIHSDDEDAGVVSDVGNRSSALPGDQVPGDL